MYGSAPKTSATGSHVVPVMNPSPNVDRTPRVEFRASISPIATIRHVTPIADSSRDGSEQAVRQAARAAGQATWRDGRCGHRRYLNDERDGGKRRGPSSAALPARGGGRSGPDRRAAVGDAVELVDRLLLDRCRQRGITERRLRRLAVGQRPEGEGDEGLALVGVLLVDGRRGGRCRRRSGRSVGPAPLMIGCWRKSAGKLAAAASAAAVTPSVEPATNWPSAFLSLARRQARPAWRS